MTQRYGGFGAEYFGDPLGGGGPLHVVRALAVASQVVRVVFNEEPLHRSAAGRSDALNPANYKFAVVAGSGTAPLAMSVDARIIAGPTRGVGNGGATDECGVDIHVDRPLVVGLSYRVTVANVQSAAGDLLGAPTTSTFPGVARLRTAQTPSRRVGMEDWATDMATGAFKVDDSGDIGTHSGVSSARERIVRRQTTSRDGFRFLPGYGVRAKINHPASPAQLADFRGDYVQQVKQEPDIADAAVQVIDQTALNILKVKTRAQLRTGGEVPVTATYAGNGTVAIS